MRGYYYRRELNIINSVLGNVINNKSWKREKKVETVVNILTI